MTYHRQNYPFQPALAGLNYSSVGATALGWADPAWASLGLMDPDQITTGALCGGAKVIQQALKDQGLYKKAIDGILGSASTSGSSMWAYKQVTGKVWPDAPSCQKLKDAQTALVIAAYAAANPPPPDVPPDVPPVVVTPGVQTGTEIAPKTPVAGGGVTKSTGTAAPPAGEDEPWYKAHWQWLALGGVAIVGVLAVYFSGGDSAAAAPAGELKANRRRSRRRNRRRRLGHVGTGGLRSGAEPAHGPDRRQVGRGSCPRRGRPREPFYRPRHPGQVRCHRSRSGPRPRVLDGLFGSTQGG